MQTSIASVAGPPSPATIKKLLRIRMMSEMVRTPAAGNIVTIPTQVADISEDWVKMVVNQWKVGCSYNLPDCEVLSFSITALRALREPSCPALLSGPCR